MSRSSETGVSWASLQDNFVKVCGITKSFLGVLANDHIDFDIEPGEIHGLLGENGAGKSTLMNILSGLTKPDEGDIYVKDEKVRFRSPKEAIEKGVFMVHQHFMLIPSFTVAESIILGTKLPREPLLDIQDVKERIVKLSKAYELPINPVAKISQLSSGERQRVEILKGLYREADVLILDEPTSNLSPIEVSAFFDVLRKFKSEGKGVVFITHKMHEALDVCDRITILRRGKLVGTLRGKTDEKELVRMMVGEDYIQQEMKKKHGRQGTEERPLLKVVDFSVMNDLGDPCVTKLGFTVYPGEILAIAGVAGNGQSELVEALTGLRKIVSGKVIFDGQNVTGLPVSKLYGLGVYHIPEKRLEMGVSAEMTVAENIILGAQGNYTKGFLLDGKAIQNSVCEIITKYSVKTTGPKAPVKTLSGGNIQRLILGRVLCRSPKLLVANQPTAGLDLSATNFIHSQINLKDKGAGVMLVSTDLDEVFFLSDRILVMYKGESMGTVRTDSTTREEVGMMMAGVKKTSEVSVV